VDWAKDVAVTQQTSRGARRFNFLEIPGKTEDENEDEASE
jgi:hypothetical protein